MVKGRNDEIFVAFLDMEIAYDRVNRNKLFEIMRYYGVHFFEKFNIYVRELGKVISDMIRNSKIYLKLGFIQLKR